MGDDLIRRENLTFLAIIDVNNPFAVWECAIGRMRSACDIPGKTAVSSFLYNKLRIAAAGDIEWLHRELELEKIRIDEFPNMVSRLSGVFLFADQLTATTARKQWGLSAAMTEITEVNFSIELGNWHDSKWINDGRAVAEWGRAYWQGRTKDVEPIWEFIASGIGLLVSREVRERCYQRASANDPHATLFLAGAASGFACGYQDVGLVVPYFSVSQDALNGSYLMYEQDFREIDWAEVAKLCDERGYQFPVRPEIHEELRTPNFSAMDFEIKWQNSEQPTAL